MRKMKNHLILILCVVFNITGMYLFKYDTILPNVIGIIFIFGSCFLAAIHGKRTNGHTFNS